jgi:DNA-binding response OmpR family regulator
MSRVLIIDDETEMASLVAMCLDPLDVEVVQASGLDAALRMAREGPVGLVLLDLALGDEDGLEILPRLRADPSLSGVPVVAFSAHDSRRREAISSGVDFFVRRPFEAADLQATVKTFLVPPPAKDPGQSSAHQ